MSKKQLVLTVPGLLFVLIAVLPIVCMYIAAVSKTGFLNELFLNERQFNLLYRSLTIGFWTGFFSLLIGLPLAFLIARTDLPCRKIFKILFVIPLLIPLYITALGWINIYGFKVCSIRGVVLVLTLGLFPIVFFIVNACLNSIEPELEEIGYVMLGKFKTIMEVTFRLIIPAVVASFLFVFILAISNFSVPAALQVNVYPIEIFSQISAFNSFEDAIIISLPLLTLTGIVIAGLRFLILKKSYVSVFGRNRQKTLIKLGKWKYFWWVFCFIVVFLSLLLPVGILLKKSFNLDAYIFAFETSYRELIRSLLFSIIGASVIVVFSFFMAYVKRNNHYLLLFALPSTLIGAALINFWNKNVFSFLYKSPLIIIFLYITSFLPIGIEIVLVALNQLDKSFEEAGQSLGTTWRKIITGIVVPILKPSLLVVWMISFVLCFGELGGSLMVTPAGMATLPMRMYNLMHYESSSLTAALAIITLVVMGIPIAVLFNIKTEWHRYG